MDTEQDREFAKAEREDRKFAEAMQELVRFAPFQVYWESLNKRIDNLASRLFEPLDEHPNAAARHEYDKGTLKGLMLARDIPSIMVQVMTQEASGDPGDDSGTG